MIRIKRRKSLRKMLCMICAVCVVLMNMSMGVQAEQAAPMEYQSVEYNKGTLIARLKTNVRSGPGTQHQILTQMKPGEECVVLGEEGDWYQIRYDRFEGYIAKEYVRVEVATTQVPLTGELPECEPGFEWVKIYVGTINALLNVNMRTGGGTNFPMVLQLAPGDRVQILTEEENIGTAQWQKTIYGDQEGYIISEYLDISAEWVQMPIVEPTAEPEIEATAEATAEPTAEPTLQPGYEWAEQAIGRVISLTDIYVRAGAGTDQTVLGHLTPGSEFVVTGEEGSWYRFDYNGRTGYAAQEFVTVEVRTTQVPSVTPTPGLQSGYEWVEQTMGRVISLTEINMRAGAGTNHKILGALVPGTEFIITGEEGDWYQISYEGRTGYAAKEFVAAEVRTTQMPMATPTPEPEPGYEWAELTIGRVISRMEINVRVGAGTTHDSRGQIAPGSEVVVTGEEGDWYRIDYNGAAGYVAKEFIQTSVQTTYRPIPTATPVPTPTREPTPTPVPAPTAWPGHELRQVMQGTVTAASSVSIRSGTDPDDAAIAYIAPGKTCIVLGEHREWYQIEFGGQQGYVAKEYLHVEEAMVQIPLYTASPTPAETPAPTLAPVQTTNETDVPPAGYEMREVSVGVVNAKMEINVRSGAGTQHTALMQLAPGSRCIVLGEENGWYRVEVNGQTGYIINEYLTVKAEMTAMPIQTPEPTPSQRPAAKEGYKWVERIEGVLIGQHETNVRRGPGTNYGVITGMKPGETCRVLGEENGWYQIDFKGRIGYISAGYLSTRTYEELVEIIVEPPLNVQLVQADLPRAIVRGAAFSLEGTIQSNNPLTGVVVTVYDLRSMTVEMSASAALTYEAHVTDYDLHDMDEDLGFRRLTAGEKRLNITVYSTNEEKVVIDEEFYVLGEFATMNGITGQCEIRANAGNAGRAADGRYNTVWQGAAPGDMLTVSVPEGHVSETLTLEWEKSPASFEVLLDGRTITVANEERLIHFNLPTDGAKKISIRVSNAQDALCELRVYEQGRTPEILQNWKNPDEGADMMVIAARPGEEFLYFGGAIPQAISEGKSVVVVYMTDCGRERAAEAMNALWAIGVRTHPIFLNLSNSTRSSYEETMESWGLENTYELLVEALRRCKPDVVLTHEIEGENGDNQRKLTCTALRRAVLLATDSGVYPESSVKYGVWDVKKTYIHRYEGNVLTLDPDVRMESLNGWTLRERITMAFSKYRSLLNDYALSDGERFDPYTYGIIRSTTEKADTEKTGFFENID